MKIRKVTSDTLPKALGLLRSSFQGSDKEALLVEKLHKNNRYIEDWVCLHKGKVIGYIAFTSAYINGEVCGLHLGPVAVKPELQNEGVGSELLEFALRQKTILGNTIYTLGRPGFFGRFGFTNCANTGSSSKKGKRKLLVKGEYPTEMFTIGYEKEFEKL